MKFRRPLLRHIFARLMVGLLLLVGLCITLGFQVRPAHAATTLTVSNCSNDSQLQADVSTANSDNAGDTITFSCSGDIVLSSTLTISGSMTLDGSGQSVTLDGNNSVGVLSVSSSGNLTLNALTITHGSAGSSSPGGGGLDNQGGTVTISNSTFANNSAPLGGGLDNESGTVTISNSTFANNSAIGSDYGGVGGAIEISIGTVSISNSTFANNSADFGGGSFYNNNSGTLSIGGSIVANNAGGNCIGEVSDQGYNLESGTNCGFTGTGSLQNTDPKLDPNGLQNNGGPTQTIALLSGSPAIDQIPVAQCPATDQRGNVRPDNGETTCDMGAYEFSDPSLTLSGTNVSATEGAAFSAQVASGTYSGSGTLSASITWGDGSSTATGTMSLNGSGFTVSGSHTYAEEGSYTIQVSVSDGQGQSASTTSTATVSDAPLTLTYFLAGPLSHRSAGVGATFTDADPAGTVSDYTASITWGDGTTSTVKVVKNPIGKGFVLAGVHTYAKSGTYSLTLTVKDQGGSQITKTVSVVVK